jgi:Second BRCT domain on Nijmegen syndrome breakage protein
MESGLHQVRQILEPFDIKLSTVFERDATSHVVAAKRNAPQVLEGLVSACYIVTEGYLDALVSACTATDPGKEAPLQADFDANWPDPMPFVPPTSKEPVPRPVEYLAPKNERRTVFANITFVFCSENQIENLCRAINFGSGKAILWEEYEEGVSNARDLAAFVRKNSSSKSTSARDSRVALLVQIQTTEPNLEWKSRFIQETDRILGQRSIAQNEFLDAILTCDTSSFQTRTDDTVMVDSTSQTGMTKSVRAEESASREVSLQMKKEESSPVKTLSTKRLKYGKAISRFKGFDDFNDDSFPTASSVSQDQRDVMTANANAGQEENEDGLNESLQHVDSMNRGKKRSLQQSAIDSLLPAAAAMKRRRIELGLDQQSASMSNESQPIVEAKPEKKRIFKRTLVPKEMTGDAEFEKATREAEKKAEEEERKQPLTSEEVEEIRHGIQIESMPFRTLQKPVQEVRDSRWDPRWNGRRNYKKFKKRGEGAQPLRGPRVTVRLQEARKHETALGATRWANASNGARNTVTGSTAREEYDSDGNDDSQFRRSDQRTSIYTSNHSFRVDNMSESEFSDLDTADISVDLEVLPARLRRKGDDDSHSQAGVQPSIQSTTTRRPIAPAPSGIKRPAAGKTSTARSPPAKKAASSANVSRTSKFGGEDVDTEGSEDELRFRGRRKRG